MLFACNLICSFCFTKTSVKRPRAARHYAFAPREHAATLFFGRGRGGDWRLSGYILSHAPPQARARWLAFADQRARTAEMGTHRLRCLAYPTSCYAPKDDC